MATPVIVDHWLHQQDGSLPPVERRYRGRGGQTPRIIVLHIQEGASSWGAVSWFRQVTASCTVTIQKDGSIWRLVPESDGPWTNGDVSNPTAKGVDIMNRYGWDPNWYALTIETEGFTGEWPKPKAMLDSVVWQIRTWMDRYGIPLENVLRHADINQTSRRYCPGDAYFNYVINALKGGAHVPLPQVPFDSEAKYATAQPVMDGDKAWDGGKDLKTATGTLFYAQKGTVEVSADALNCRVFAGAGSGLTRAPLVKGETFEVLGWVEGEAVEGENRWWVTPYGSRIWAGGTVQKPKKAAPKPTTPPKTPTTDTDGLGLVKIVNGRVYYPAGNGGKGREITTTVDANVRQWTGLDSKVLTVLPKGTKLTALYWCRGDVVGTEDVWWVIDPDGAGKLDPFNDGGRIHVSVTDVRPA